jgi:hypothetical protein
MLRVSGRVFAALVEQVSRYVTEDHRSRGSDGLGGGERDQPVTAPDVEHRLPGFQGGVGEDAVPDRRESLRLVTEQFWITVVAALVIHSAH